jgi:hypothetical protein
MIPALKRWAILNRPRYGLAEALHDRLMIRRRKVMKIALVGKTKPGHAFDLAIISHSLNGPSGLLKH